MKLILSTILTASTGLVLAITSLCLSGCGPNNAEQKPAAASPSTPKPVESNATLADTKPGQNTGNGKETVIRLTARKFEYSPSQITVKKGSVVVLELTSKDRLHGFNLPDFKIRSDIKPNVVTRVQFTPDKTGSFTFACDIYCGDGHEEMSGTLVVVD